MVFRRLFCLLTLFLALVIAFSGVPALAENGEGLEDHPVEVKEEAEKILKKPESDIAEIDDGTAGEPKDIAGTEDGETVEALENLPEEELTEKEAFHPLDSAIPESADDLDDAVDEAINPEEVLKEILTGDANVPEENAEEAESAMIVSPSEPVTESAEEEAILPGENAGSTMDTYIRQMLYGPSKALRGTVAYYALSENEKRLYDGLKTYTAKLAAGELSYSVVTIPVSNVYEDIWLTAEELGVDRLTYIDDKGQERIDENASRAYRNRFPLTFQNVLSALLFDFPFDLYWQDKTIPSSCTGSTLTVVDDRLGVKLTNSDGSPTLITVRFPVSKDYSVTGERRTYDLDTSYGATVQAAVANAKKIVADNAGKTDLQKLRAYADTICEITDYNYDAAGTGDQNYGNPWQIIWVFDGDPDTKVVCEGYAKAFQYLCDQSSFSGDIETITVESRSHMWNLVTLDDGYQYLVDLTTMDTTGDNLFMRGYTQKVSEYKYYYRSGTSTYPYVFNETTYNLFHETGHLDPDPFWKITDGVLYLDDAPAGMYTSAADVPWAPQLDEIREVVVGEAVSSIGDYVLAGLTLQKLVLSSFVETISATAAAGTTVEEVIVEHCGDYAETWAEENNFNYIVLNHKLTAHENYWQCDVCRKLFSDAEGKNEIPVVTALSFSLEGNTRIRLEVQIPVELYSANRYVVFTSGEMINRIAFTEAAAVHGKENTYYFYQDVLIKQYTENYTITFADEVGNEVFCVDSTGKVIHAFCVDVLTITFHTTLETSFDVRAIKLHEGIPASEFYTEEVIAAETEIENFQYWTLEAPNEDGSYEKAPEEFALTDDNFVEEDLDLYAYKSFPRQYTVTFLNDDGSVLKEATAYDYGTSAEDIEQPETPTKPATEEETYTFFGWAPEVADVTEDAVYTATYITEEITNIIFDGALVNFSGQIRMGVQFTLTDVCSAEIYKGYAVRFETEDGTTEIALENGTDVSRDNNAYRYYLAIPIPYYSKVVTIGLVKDGNQAYFVKGGELVDSIEYSVKKYAESGTGSETMKKLKAALAQYGMAAENKFNGAANDIGDLSAATFDGIGEIVKNGTLPEGLTFAGTTVNFSSDNALKVVFTVAEGHTIDEYKFEIDGQEATATLRGGSNFQLVLPNIAAANLAKTHTFIASDDSASYSVITSPLVYAKSRAAKSDDANMVALAKTLYLYYLAAKDQFK